MAINPLFMRNHPLFFVPVPVPVLMLMLMLMLMCSFSLEVDAAKPAKAAKAAKAGSAKAATAAKATTASATVDASKAVSAPVPAANPQAAPAVIEEIPVAADAREAYGRGQSAFKDGKALFAIRSFLEGPQARSSEHSPHVPNWLSDNGLWRNKLEGRPGTADQIDDIAKKLGHRGRAGCLCAFPLHGRAF